LLWLGWRARLVLLALQRRLPASDDLLEAPVAEGAA
jgi:hypothetical protein